MSEPAVAVSEQARPVDVAAASARRWWILGVVGLAQLMVVLDATIVNIALPSAQRSLGFSNADRQWVVTAYSLAFGGLLLLGGRLSDLVGRRRRDPGRLRDRMRAGAGVRHAGTHRPGRRARGVTLLRDLPGDQEEMNIRDI